MTKRRLHLAILWTLTALWTLLLFIFSGQDGQESADLSMRITQLVLRLFPGLPCSFDSLHFFLRKLAHFTIFGVEGALLSLSIHLQTGRARAAVCIALPACAVIAALNEYHQSFMEGRVASPMDVGIDFAGAAVGVGLIWLAGRLLRRRNAKGS